MVDTKVNESKESTEFKKSNELKTTKPFEEIFKDYVQTADFGKHHHSVSVTKFKHPITKHKIIKKTFGTTPHQVKAFESEIENLEHLKGCDFVPKLYHIDKPNRTLYLSYCGKKPKHLTRPRKQDIVDKLKTLKTNYGIERSFYYLAHPGFPRTDNITIHHGEMKLIDFGPPWDIKKKTKNTKKK